MAWITVSGSGLTSRTQDNASGYGDVTVWADSKDAALDLVGRGFDRWINPDRQGYGASLMRDSIRDRLAALDAQDVSAWYDVVVQVYGTDAGRCAALVDADLDAPADANLAALNARLGSL